MSWAFHVIGDPVAQPRHQIAVVRGRAMSYLPKATRGGKKVEHPVVAYKRAIALSALAAGIRSPLEGPVCLQIQFLIPFLKRVKERDRDDAIAHAVRKPDIDNLAKAVMDALTGLAYRDDHQIVRLLVEKVAGDFPATHVRISSLSGVKQPIGGFIR